MFLGPQLLPHAADRAPLRPSLTAASPLAAPPRRPSAASCLSPCPLQLNQRGFGACEGMTITDPHLLMYVMEAREEVEGASDTQSLQALQRENAAMEAKCIQVGRWVAGLGRQAWYPSVRIVAGGL